MEELNRQELIAALRRVGRQDSAEVDIAHAALVVGALDRPDTDLSPYLGHLQDIESALRRLLASGPRRSSESHPTLAEKAGALSQVLAVDYGYRGDHLTYDDLRNANLLDVIDRGQGLPVSLGILYIHAARSQGWHMEGLNVPGHFVVRLTDGAGAVILDPFNGGGILHQDEVFNLQQQFAGDAGSAQASRAVSSHEILLRLQNNLLTRHLQRAAPEKAVEVLERMRLLAPAAPELAFDLGGLHAHLGHLLAAMYAYQDCLALAPAGALADRARDAVTALRRKLN